MATVEQIKALTVECSCSTCQKACTHKPGWFAPGEAEAVATHLGLTLEQLFKQHLMVDWHDDVDGVSGDVFLLSPAVDDETPGEEFPGDPRGRCVFYKDGKCSIHAVKPKECREYVHGDSSTTVRIRHEVIAAEWVEHQQQIKDLLGRKPISSEFYGSGFGGLML